MANRNRSAKEINQKICFLMVAASLLLAVQPAAAIIFTDGDFVPSEWQGQTFLTHTSTATASTIIAGGVPGDHREILLYSSSGFLQPTGRSMLVDLKTSAVVSPASLGGITNVDYVEDHRCSCFGGGVLWGPALEQGGVYYIVPGNATPNSLTAPWVTVSLAGLTELDFEEVLVTAPGWTDGSSHPDFSAAGGPITFGYVRAKAFVATTPSYLDNWVVSVNETAVGVETQQWGALKSLYR